MKPLIIKSVFGWQPNGNIAVSGDVKAFNDCMDALAAYIDTELTPEEITVMQAELQKYQQAEAEGEAGGAQVKEIMACFKAYGLAEDEYGNKDYAGVAVKLKVGDDYDGETDLAPDYDKSILAGMLGCQPEDITPISRAEYEAEYGEGDSDR